MRREILSERTSSMELVSDEQRLKDEWLTQDAEDIIRGCYKRDIAGMKNVSDILRGNPDLCERILAYWDEYRDNAEPPPQAGLTKLKEAVKKEIIANRASATAEEKRKLMPKT